MKNVRIAVILVQTSKGEFSMKKKNCFFSAAAAAGIRIVSTRMHPDTFSQHKLELGVTNSPPTLTQSSINPHLLSF